MDATTTPGTNLTTTTANPICRNRQAPYSYEILQRLDTTGQLLFAMLTLMTAISVVIFIEEAIYMYNKISGSKKSTFIWINATAPIIAVTSCFAMWIPKSTMFTDFTSNMFLAIFIHKFQLMLITECGGRRKFLEKFGDKKLQLHTGPLCCCCLCFPLKDIHSGTVFFLKLGTLQFAVLKPILVFLAVVLWTNGNYVSGVSLPEYATLYINLTSGVITILALWAVGIMFNLVRPTLSHKNVISKFAAYQFVVILTQLQTSIISILGNIGVIACIPPLPSSSRASYMNQQLMIMEMFLTTVTCRILYRKKETFPVTDEDEVKKENVQNSSYCLTGNGIDDSLPKV